MHDGPEVPDNMTIIMNYKHLYKLKNVWFEECLKLEKAMFSCEWSFVKRRSFDFIPNAVNEH